jgi:hypothetical protein
MLKICVAAVVLALASPAFAEVPMKVDSKALNLEVYRRERGEERYRLQQKQKAERLEVQKKQKLERAELQKKLTEQRLALRAQK